MQCFRNIQFIKFLLSSRYAECATGRRTFQNTVIDFRTLNIYSQDFLEAEAYFTDTLFINGRHLYSRRLQRISGDGGLRAWNTYKHCCSSLCWWWWRETFVGCQSFLGFEIHTNELKLNWDWHSFTIMRTADQEIKLAKHFVTHYVGVLALM